MENAIKFPNEIRLIPKQVRAFKWGPPQVFSTTEEGGGVKPKFKKRLKIHTHLFHLSA